MYVFVYTLLILSYIVQKLFPLDLFSYSVGILAVIAILISFRKASGLYFIMGLFFLTSGWTLFLYSRAPWYTFFLHFETMLGLLSLFLMLPFVSSIIHIGHFDRQLNQLLNLKTKQLSQLYLRSSLVSHLLGIFLNIATIPLLVRSLSISLTPFQDGITNRFYSRSLLRAYALCLTWSPFEVLVSIAIDSSNVKYYQIFPITFLLAIVFMVINWFIFSFDQSSYLSIKSSDLNLNKRKRIKKKIIQLIGVLFIFITVVSLVDYFIGYGFLFSVVIVILPFSLTAAFLMKKVKQYLTITIPHWKEHTNNLANYFFMFLSAGFFVDMITSAKWITYLQSFLFHFTDQIFAFYLMTGAYFLVTALAGFHPLVSLTLFTKILASNINKVSSISFALVLISCSLATVMYSPYNVSVSILSSEIKVNPYRITQWNLGFALFYMFFSICFAYFILTL